MSSQAPHDRGGHSRRRRRPAVERLEARDLPASNPLGPVLPGVHYPAPDVQQFVSILYPTGTPQPTAAEIQRESFVFKGTGNYTIGPGGFSGQSITIHGYGKPGTSNLSRRMHFQFLISEPSTTSSQQVVSGAISFVGGNYLQNGAELLLDLAGPTGSEVNGLPTHLYWAYDAASSTAFAGTGAALPAFYNFPSNYFNAQGVPVSPLSQGLAPTSVDNWSSGLGDMTLQYVPDKHPQKGSLGSGSVIIVLHGLLNYSGAQSQADKNIN
jgi:hypothetical protein